MTPYHQLKRLINKGILTASMFLVFLLFHHDVSLKVVFVILARDVCPLLLLVAYVLGIH